MRRLWRLYDASFRGVRACYNLPPPSPPPASSFSAVSRLVFEDVPYAFAPSQHCGYFCRDLSPSYSRGERAKITIIISWPMVMMMITKRTA